MQRGKLVGRSNMDSVDCWKIVDLELMLLKSRLKVKSSQVKSKSQVKGKRLKVKEGRYVTMS